MPNQVPLEGILNQLPTNLKRLIGVVQTSRSVTSQWPELFCFFYAVHWFHWDIFWRPGIEKTPLQRWSQNEDMQAFAGCGKYMTFFLKRYHPSNIRFLFFPNMKPFLKNKLLFFCIVKISTFFSFSWIYFVLLKTFLENIFVFFSNKKCFNKILQKMRPSKKTKNTHIFSVTKTYFFFKFTTFLEDARHFSQMEILSTNIFDLQNILWVKLT